MLASTLDILKSIIVISYASSAGNFQWLSISTTAM